MFIEYMHQFEDPMKDFHILEISHFKKVSTLVTSNFLCIAYGVIKTITFMWIAYGVNKTSSLCIDLTICIVFFVFDGFSP